MKVPESFSKVGEDKYARDECDEVVSGVPLRLARNLLNIEGEMEIMTKMQLYSRYWGS